MLHRTELTKYVNEYLQISNYKDYAPNGLQVEGRENIKTIVTGVSACAQLIQKAVEVNADAIMVHHGFFWKNDPTTIIGMRKSRIKSLLINDINLFGYHLPLDGHKVVGNNAQLALKFGVKDAKPVLGIAQDLVWQGMLENPLSADAFAQQLEINLKRKPLYFGNTEKPIHSLAWCSGGAQDYIDIAVDLGVDAFISGEVSERTYYQAMEQNIIYFSAGHHATEKYGIQALGEHLANKFNLTHHFIDIPNPV